MHAPWLFGFSQLVDDSRQLGVIAVDHGIHGIGVTKSPPTIFDNLRCYAYE